MKAKVDLVAGVLLILFVAYGLYLAFQLNATATTIYGPGFFPKFVLSALGIFSIILLINTLKSMKHKKDKADASNTETVTDYKIVKKILYLIILMIAYVIAFVYFGFFIPTIIFLILAEIIFGIKKAYVIILSSVLSPAIMYFLFVNLFNIPLP